MRLRSFDVKVTVLVGGVGGARFLLGVQKVLGLGRFAASDTDTETGPSSPTAHELTAVVNVGDDAWMHGVRICPDLDTCMYTLGGGIDPERGCAWDAAHAVIATMGDRFVLLRMDSTKERKCAGRRAIANTGSEDKMRSELSTAVADVLAGASPSGIELSQEETDTLLAAADLVTLARTGVEFDYRGDVIDAHAPEMPTRFAKQLAQVVRGGVAVGMSRDAAMRLAIRCARDSMPPLRLAIIDYLAVHAGSPTTEVRKGIGKPRTTVDRQLQALHMLGAVVCVEEEVVLKDKTIWRYSLSDDIDPTTLVVPEMSVGP